jgi:2-oxoisovalerate dehydrogenase E1 component
MATVTETIPGLARERALALYREMLVIRWTEEAIARAHAEGRVHGACHTYVGEEAVAVGVSAHLRPDDTVLSTHRGHGHALAKGVAPRALMAELFGRVTGCSRGRGGSMHLFAPEVGLLGTSGIVGPSIVMATGAGYSYRLLGNDRVSVAFFGDGAVNNGAFHEGLNLAAIWSLPVLFVCENNLYATEVPFETVAGNPDVAARGVAYGLPSVRLDGNDVLAVHEAAGEAVRRARRGDGPTLLECLTYRTRAHSEGMRDAGYRTRDEVEAWKVRCPIARWRNRLLAAGGVAASDLDRIDQEVAALVKEAAEFAEASPWPDPATATRHVYAEPGETR